MTFQDAGDDTDLRAAHLDDQIEKRRQEGDQLLEEVQALLQGNPSTEDCVRAEQRARQALERLARSLDWAEDGPREEECHRRMDAAGRLVRETFGCEVERDGSEYFQSCPVALAHNRLGMSIGGAATRVCSLCGEDLSECEHMRGRSYLVPGGNIDLGWCRVCLAESGCDHRATNLYRVGVVSIITKGKIDEISLVNKPAHPEARLVRVSIDTAELSTALGPDFVPGMRVNCDRCLEECGGLIKHDDLPHQ